jgi:hypothetical protein
MRRAVGLRPVHRVYSPPERRRTDRMYARTLATPAAGVTLCQWNLTVTRSATGSVPGWTMTFATAPRTRRPSSAATADSNRGLAAPRH